MPGLRRRETAIRDRLIRILERLHLKRLARKAVRAVLAPGIQRVAPHVIRVLEHDAQAHTQGLAYIGGVLYESTGRTGHSTLRRLDIESGAVLESRSIPDVWAEGIAIRQNRLVQLTYTEQMATVYRLPNLEVDGAFCYEGEGWGLAAAEQGYVMSNGTHMLTFRDAGFEPVRQLQVYLAGRPLSGLNDLECAYGRIYANAVLHSDIYEISPQTGEVLRLIDCTAIVDRARQKSSALVLNGIAFAPDRNTFFITGKKWPVMFEVQWNT